MVLYCLKWNIHPDKAEAYATWSKGAIQRTLGAFQVVVTYEFADMAAWAAWHETETVQAVLTEVHTLANDVTSDLWGPSPIVPQPIRPES
jgi:hypothetical protein